MPIRVQCSCGKAFSVADQHAGKRGKCPACGAVIQVPAAAVAEPVAAPQPQAVYAGDAESDPYATAGDDDASAGGAMEQGEESSAPAYAPSPLPALQYASPGGGGGPIAPPPPLTIRLPAELPPKLRRPTLPPCHLVFITQGADLNANFDLAPALQSLAESMAKKLKKRFNLQLVQPPPGAMAAYVRIISMDEGNRWLRYFLGIFFGATTFEIEGTVITPAAAQKPFHFKHRGRLGFVGGSSIGLLKAGGKVLGGKVGKAVLKA